jgi:hypothetical protein
MIHPITAVRKTALLLFFALTACYLILTPGSLRGYGYIDEEVNAGNWILNSVSSWFGGQPRPELVVSRHGPVSVLFDLPFLVVGKFLVSQDFILAMQPMLLTAGLLALVFLWLRKFATPTMSFVLTLTGAFGTMLWPYAYIGLETKQSFLILLAAYFALARGRLRGWPEILLFGIIGGLSLTVKVTGIVMWPAVAWLVYVQFRDDWRVRRPQWMTVSVLIAGIWAVGAILRSPYWDPIGGEVYNFQGWMTYNPIRMATNFIGILGSPGKGLFVFAPVLMLCLYAIPRAFRSSHRDLVVFAMLLATCTAAFISLLIVTSDEVWGPRYMHVVIAPLLLCIGAAWPRLEWKILLPLTALAAAGFVVSFLGSFSSYAVPSRAMRDAGQNTIEWINGDPVWGGPEFEFRLFRTWLTPGEAPVLWTPFHRWVWVPPTEAPMQWKTIDLRNYSTPQSMLLQYWNAKPEGTIRITFYTSMVSMFVGPMLLFWCAVRTRKEARPPSVG